MRTDDERLLELLGQALLVEQPEPSPLRVVALRRAVAEHSTAAPTRIPRLRRRLMQRSVPVLVAGGLVVSAGTAAAAATGTLPRPARALAHDLGLPVDSPTLLDTRAAQDNLRDSLADDNRSAVRRDATELRSKLHSLDGDERDQVEPGADSLLKHADTLLATPTPPSPPPDTPDTTPPDTTPPDTTPPDTTPPDTTPPDTTPPAN